ncbi:interleukin-22 receptor subunit alpha-1-like isoform X1 [Arapaima gigas]
MWHSALVLLVVSCTVNHLYAAELQRSTGAYFVSRNFQNVLHWEQQFSPDDPVLYSVQYNIYGEEWQEKLECQNITTLSCDLTAEMADITLRYHGKVMANGTKLFQTVRFRPLQDTVLGAPTVSLSPKATSVSLTMWLPVRPNDRTSLEGVLRNATNVNLFIDYTVTLTPIDQMLCNNSLDPQRQLYTTTSEENEVTISNLKPDTEYCGMASYTVEYDYKLKHSEVFVFRVKTCKEPLSSRHLFIGSAVLGTLVFGFLLLLAAWQYVVRKNQMPDALNVQGKRFPPPSPNLTKEGDCITKVEVYPTTPSTQHILLQFKAARDQRTQVEVTGGNGDCYTPQDCSPVTPWHCHSYLNQQVAPAEHSSGSQSSTQYSVVVGIQRGVTVDHFQNRKDTNVTRAPALNSCGSLQNPQLGTLMLPAQRGPDGLLQLSGLLPLLQTEDDLTSWTSSTFREGVPLLSDLVMEEENEQLDFDLRSDEVTRTCMPCQVSSLCDKLPHPTCGTTSNPCPSTEYRQMWIPTVPPPPESSKVGTGCGSADFCVWPEEEGGTSLLEGWGVKIQ